MIEARQRRRELLQLAGILLLAAAVRVHHLGERPLWYDEGATWRFSLMTHEDLWRGEGRRETNPPLFYSMQRLWRVFGESEAAIRSLACAFGVAAVGLLYGYGRCLGGARLGTIAALLGATSALWVEYSQEARTYMALTCAAIGAMWSLAWLFKRPVRAGRFIHRRTLGAWAGYGGCVTIGLYLHNTAFAIPTAATIAAGIWWLTVGRRRAMFVVNWMIVNGIALLAWLDWLAAVLAQMGGIKEWWLPPLTWTLAYESLRTLAGQAWLGGVWQPWIDLLFLALGVAGVAAWRRRTDRVAGSIGLAAGMIAALAAASLSSPMFLPRMLLAASPGWLVLVAGGIAALRRRGWVVAVTALVVGVQLRAVMLYDRFADKGAWDEAAAHLRNQARADDLLLFDRADFDVCIDYYFRHQPDDPAAPNRLALTTHPAELTHCYSVLPVIPRAQAARLFDRYPRLWVISWGEQAETAAVLAARGRVADRWVFSGDSPRHRAVVSLYEAANAGEN